MSAANSDDDPGADSAPGSEIAIIGMAARFPGARDVAAFWRNLLDGVESVTTFTDEQLRAAGESERNLRNPSYVRANPVLEGLDQFDADFFGFSPKDAAITDPAHRLFLEVAWHAFEHAGHTALPAEGAVGVFATSGASLYLMDHLRTNPHLVETVGEFLLRHTGNDQSFLATRVSYELDLRGPSINVQTACSSALVAVYMATQSLLSGECDLALAGGSTILLPHGRGYVYQDGEIMSRDGHCRPFDAQASGTVFGSGVGAVVLARLSDAIANGDTIYAVIRGAAINNDGSVKVGYLAPSVDAQAACVAEAFALSGVEPETISYVEAHGTATRVGDPIEVTALTQAFRRFTKESGFCAIGSVKSNVGHLGEAAAMPGLIKTALALHHGVLPASLGYTQPNEQIDFPTTPFVVNAARRAWQPRSGVRRAGITALGAGGTNCHIVLEQPPSRAPSAASAHPELLVVSAKSHEALDGLCGALAETLADPTASLADVAHTLQVGRRALSHRCAVVASSREEARALLESREPPRFVRDVCDDTQRRVAFLFPGGGAQYARMGAELYDKEPVYRDAFESCLACLGAEQASSLRALVLTPDADPERAAAELSRPSRTLPTLFATEYAFAKLLQSWGVTPDALGGHSMGEYVAACLAGVFSLQTAMQLVALRGRLFERTEPGGMLAVQLSAERLKERLPRGLDIAAINGPDLCVASGPKALLDELARALQRDDIDTTRVHIDVAAHSALLDPVLPEFQAFLRSVQFSPPKTRFVSNLTGTWITAEQATDPSYWVQHLRSTVQFSRCLETLFAADIDVLVEVGPGNTLSSLGRLQATRPRLSCNTMRHPQEAASDRELALRTLGKLWAAGVSIEWSELRGDERRNRVPLPLYPFSRTSYWIEPGRVVDRASTLEAPLRKRVDVEQWFSTLSWARTTAPLSRPDSGAEQYLVFVDKLGVGKALARRFNPDRVTCVVPGRALIRRSSDEYEIDPNDPVQFERLVRELHDRGRGPTRVVYMWTLGLVDELLRNRSWARAADRVQRAVGGAHDFASSHEACFAAPFHLCRSLGAFGSEVELTVVTSAAHQLGDEIGEPRKALALGPALVAPHEFARMRTRVVDVTAAWVPGRSQTVVEQLEREVTAPVEDRVIALRGPDRWTRRIEPCRLPAFDASKLPLGPESCVVISGGLGGIGIEIASALAETWSITLVLLGRSGVPEPHARDSWLESHPTSDVTSQRILRLRALEQKGARVQVRTVDVTDASAVRALFVELEANGTPVTGVVHAAGTVDDALMMEKRLPDALRVMAAKVEGALALDAASGERRLDFFVAFSSVASFLGLPGQSDYTAANAFLDAFAARREALGRGRTFVVNWNAWSEVGMAAALSLPRAQSELARLRVESATHADLDGFVRTRDGFLFFADLSLTSHWIVGEHRVRGGLSLIPGTGHLELLVGAYREATGQSTVSIRDVRFLAPFQVEGAERKRLFLRLVRAEGDSFEARIFGSDEAMPCVAARLCPLEERAVSVDVPTVRARTTVRTDEIGGFMRQSFVDFGPRWSNLVRTHYGQDEALIELALPAALAGDLAVHPFHPALADMATGSVQHLVPGFDPANQFFVPFSYEQVDVLHPLSAELVSHVRYTGGSSGETATFDVAIAQPDGRVLADARGFMMRRVGKGAVLVDSTSRPPGPRTRTPQADRVDDLLANAIAPEEGTRAFLRLLAGFSGSQCTVSSVDPLLWMKQLDLEAQQMSADAADKPTGFARPKLATPYRAPETPEQELVARIWSELLGIQSVGIDDDFNQLGGQSLLAIRMVERIRKETGTAISLSTLFDAPTVARIATKITVKGAGPAAHQSLTPIREGGQHAPLFMPHGVGGTVHWGYANIAKHLKPGVPVVGLKVAPAECVTFEDMCAFYVNEMRSVQPQGPYYLGGYCYGGNVAYEIARQLRDAGQDVALLALIEAWPVNTDFGKVEWTPSYAVRFAENLPYFASDFVARPGRDQLASVRRKLAGFGQKLLPAPAPAPDPKPDATDSIFDRLGPPPPGADLLDVRTLGRYGEGEMDTWERCIRALWRYVPPPIDVHGLVIRTRRQPLFSPHEPEMGWRPLLTRGLDAYTIPGSHFTVMDVRDVVEVARLLNEALD